MRTKLSILALLMALFPMTDYAQKVTATATYLDENNNLVDSSTDFTAEAPLDVTFSANPTDMGDHTPAFEWHIRKETDEQDLVVRYEEDTQYTFTESGAYQIVLKTRLEQDGTELDSVAITLTISDSQLEFPNAFSPNGDGANDTFKAKTGWRNIVKFRGIIVNRWGQKLYEWNDPAGEWDGTFNGHRVHDGVYFLQVTAKGSDGKDYHIRQDINVLTGYSREGGQNSGNQ